MSWEVFKDVAVNESQQFILRLDTILKYLIFNDEIRENQDTFFGYDTISNNIHNVIIYAIVFSTFMWFTYINIVSRAICLEIRCLLGGGSASANTREVRREDSDEKWFPSGRMSLTSERV